MAMLPRSTSGQLALAGLAGAGVGSVLAPPGAIVLGAVVPPAVLVVRARARSRFVRNGREADVADACLALAGELRAGVPPDRALTWVAREWPDLFASAAGRAAVGSDPVVALRATASQRGAESLAAVASAWEVSNRTGAALSSTLIAVADALRAEASTRREAESQLATVRVTSRLLAVLPVATLLLFSSGGGAPIDFLLTNPYGLACLLGALVFIGAGMGWVARTSRLAVTNAWQQ
jgi:tight adherence protein B